MAYTIGGEAQVDCVIPAHEKDFETLPHTVASIRECCPEVRRIIVISRTPLPSSKTHFDSVEHFDEAAVGWPFKIHDLEQTGCPPGWIFQQLLKLYAPSIVPGLLPSVLVCDADVVWLAKGGVRFLDDVLEVGSQPVARLCIFNSESCPPIRSAVDLHRYDAFVPAVLPNLTKPNPGVETAVCHHTLLQRDILDALFESVQEAAGKPFWEAFRDASFSCGGRASEYELYHAFARRSFPNRVVPRQLAFAVVADFQSALVKAPAGVTFFVAHSHLRGLPPKELRDREGIINGDVCAEVVRRMTQGHPPELAALLAGSGML